MKILLVTFCLVFLRAFQQQNVIHSYYVWAAATSYMIAMAEVAMVLWVVATGWAAVPYVGTGGALGVVAAMITHKKFLRKKG